MKRDAITQLLRWKTDFLRKPMLLLGARQVGKTWLMKEFGKQEFSNVAYIRFDLDEQVKRNFEQDLNIKRLLQVIQLHAGFRLIPGKTLIIFDEIQECPEALTSLKYFCEEAPEYHVMAAGSLLGLYEHKGTGFPVGKVDMITLYPMSFREFLSAIDKELYVELLDSDDETMVNNFSASLTDMLKIYYYVGGMPEAVKAYVQTGDFNRVRAIHQALLLGYQRDFSKHAPKEVTPRISLIWDSIPAQLSRENKKFTCKTVEPGLRMRDLEVALQWLYDAGLLYSIPRISKPAIPVAAYKEAAFKTFFLDVGLLAAHAELPAKVILEGNRIFCEFKGALAEQYVQQELRATSGLNPVYWSAENGRAEVDFIIQHEMELVPIEVKAESNLQAKSLKVYCRKFHCAQAIRASMALWNEQSMPLDDAGSVCRLINLPLYAVYRAPVILRR